MVGRGPRGLLLPPLQFLTPPVQIRGRNCSPRLRLRLGLGNEWRRSETGNGGKKQRRAQSWEQHWHLPLWTQLYTHVPRQSGAACPCLLRTRIQLWVVGGVLRAGRLF